MTNRLSSTDPLRRAAGRLKALGHPTRLRIVALLRQGPLCICQIRAVVGGAASTLSAHLAVLRQAGLVEESREGRWVYAELSGHPVARFLIRAALAEADASPLLQEDTKKLAEVQKVSVAQLCSAGLEPARVRKEAGVSDPLQPRGR